MRCRWGCLQMRLPVSQVLALTALVFLSGCLGTGERSEDIAGTRPVMGPAADYPMVLGDPFTIGSTVWRPEDRLNFDEVGRAALGNAGGKAVTLAHKTLPLPSYVEVVALDSGRTILARVERRGPMSNERLIELSPGAAAQLGILADGAPVRVRRLNPPEPERALLRVGQPAPERMETPKPLLAVLLRRLADPVAPVGPPTPLILPQPKPSATPAAPGSSTPSPLAPSPAVRPPSRPQAAAVAPPPAPGAFVVQVAALSSRQRAETIANALGGQVEPAGALFRIRIGPFVTRAQATAALAKVAAAGYSEARIQRSH